MKACWLVGAALLVMGQAPASVPVPSAPPEKTTPAPIAMQRRFQAIPCHALYLTTEQTCLLDGDTGAMWVLSIANLPDGESDFLDLSPIQFSQGPPIYKRKPTPPAPGALPTPQPNRAGQPPKPR